MATTENNKQRQEVTTGRNITLGCTKDQENCQPFAFPKYCSEVRCNANSASVALNKWLKPRVPEGCVIHSFRHSLRDRLRTTECPADIIDAIGGWSTEVIGHQYGSGYSLEIKYRWLGKTVFRN